MTPAEVRYYRYRVLLGPFNCVRTPKCLAGSEEQFVVGLICTDLRSRGDSGPQRDICSKHDRLHKKRITIHGF